MMVLRKTCDDRNIGRCLAAPRDSFMAAPTHGKLQKGWEANLDTPGVVQLSYMKNLFVSRKWYELVPDQTHTVVTAGYDRLFVHCRKIRGLR